MFIDWPRATVAVVLLICSCGMMITAWYMHLRMHRWSMLKAIFLSWLIAGGEYMLQVPANRIGYQAGLSPAQLRGIAEVAILASFLLFQSRVLHEPLLWNHVVGFAIVLVGVLIVLSGPFSAEVFAVATDDQTFLRSSSIESSLEATGLGGIARPYPIPRSSPPPSPPTLLPWQQQQPSPDCSPPLAPLFSPPSPYDALRSRLDWLAASSRYARENALAELHQGQKRGHWIWWVFPTLAVRGGDMNSALQGADLTDVNEAIAYARHPELREGLISSFRAASAAFAAASGAEPGQPVSQQAPWMVLDRGFGRSSIGIWTDGPVDSFKVWSCATLFSEIARRLDDSELQQAALDVLNYFTGTIVYIAGGHGTAGYVEDKEGRRNVLSGVDAATLALLPDGRELYLVQRTE